MTKHGIVLLPRRTVANTGETVALRRKLAGLHLLGGAGQHGFVERFNANGMS